MKEQETRRRSMRTRKDLLLAATRLLRDGKNPSMEEVAEVALVSRATAYRYFQNVEDLLIEAPVDDQVPDAAQLFPETCTLSLEERADQAEAVMHEAVYNNEAQLRLMLSRSLVRERSPTEPLPNRQSRRTAYIETALAPYRKEFDTETYHKLCAALALIFGTEAMIIFRDVLPLEPSRARNVKSWAVKALVRAAMADSKAKKSVRRKN